MKGFVRMTTELKMIPASEIVEKQIVGLRPVDKTTEAYNGLVDSIRRQGILNPIVVTEVKDLESGATKYAVVDGLHRYTAGLDAGLKEFPASVKTFEETSLLEAQLIANVHVIETRPHQYAHQLKRILLQSPLLTATELATRLGKSTDWLYKILSLTKINNPEIAHMVDEGKINLSNAQSLATLPPDEQKNFVDRAMTMRPDEFHPVVATRAKQIRDAKRQGKDVQPEEFVMHPRLRSMKDLKTELKELKMGGVHLQERNITNPLDAWKAAMEWVLNLDPKSVEIRKKKEEERKKLKEDAKKRKDVEKAQQKAQEAAERAAKLTATT